MSINEILGWIAWAILAFVLILRPLSDLIGAIFLRKLVLKRKEIGIISALFIIAHTVAVFVVFDLPITAFWSESSWSFSSAFTWGLLSLIVLIPVFLTSNRFSMLRLKKWWKYIQKLSYLIFIFAGIHIYLVDGKWLYSLVPMGVWLMLFIVAEIFKNRKV
ncbi:hypothetical protein GF354_02770 [Candidatus Peregrinibacteria bacterium]|nr:hypothetical protein [Candidatus Peregrinibacteria bacterium]